MGIDSGQRRSNTGTVTWAVIAVIGLGTVLAVWFQSPDSQPPSVFGAAGGKAILVGSLLAALMAAVSRGAARAWSTLVSIVTIALAVCTEILAIAHFRENGGSADVAFGAILSAGAIALLALSIGLLRGRS